MGNYSRDTFNKLKHYVSVRLQQGVPLVDADWNEKEDIRKYELRTFLKWFIGNGVPKGNNGFCIMPPSDNTENDFIIGGGTVNQPGYCLVEGWDALIEGNINYLEQPLHDSELAGELGVSPLEVLSPPSTGEPDRIDTVYLDVWEREVDAREDSDLVNPSIGLETCVRFKREWVVRVATGTTTAPQPPEGHWYYPLAHLNRIADKNKIEPGDITDLRMTGLSVVSNYDFQQIVTDAFGSSYSLEQDGETKLNLSLRESINAILNGILSGTMPGTPPQPLTNDSKGNIEPFSLSDHEDTIWIFWHSSISDYAIYYNRFINGDWEGEQQLISGPGRDECPVALEDQAHAVWIFWHSNRDGYERIYFDCRLEDQWQGITPLSSESTGSIDSVYPFSLEDRTGRVWVFWISSENENYQVKYRRHVPGDAYDNWQAEGIVTGGSFTIYPRLSAVEDLQGDIWVFWQVPGTHDISIYCRRFLSLEERWEGPEEGVPLVKEPPGDYSPFSLTDRKGVTWFFWSSFKDGNFNIYYRQFKDNAWESDTRLTTSGGNDISPFAVEDKDGNIWVFWQLDTGGKGNIWYNRCINGTWEDERKLTTGTDDDTNPFALKDISGNIWVFWQSQNDGKLNIRYTKIITRI